MNKTMLMIATITTLSATLNSQSSPLTPIDHEIIEKKVNGSLAQTTYELMNNITAPFCFKKVCRIEFYQSTCRIASKLLSCTVSYKTIENPNELITRHILFETAEALYQVFTEIKSPTCNDSEDPALGKCTNSFDLIKCSRPVRALSPDEFNCLFKYKSH